MKKHFALLTSIILTATLGQAQTGGGTGAAGGQSGGVGQAAGAQGTGQPGQPGQSTGQAGGIGNPSPFQPRVNQPQPGVGGQEGTIFNQPAGANQPQPAPFGGTNQQVPFGGTNRVQFGTNGGTINDPAGARATNQTGGLGGATNQQSGHLSDQAFAMQMRSVLARPGATQIYFPQTRSTVSVLNQNGALVLQGSVTSEQEKNAIESRIQNTPGVVSIDNQLQVANGRSGEVSPRSPGINPAPNSQINQGQERQLLTP